MVQDDMFQELAVQYWQSDWELFAFQAVFEPVTAEHFQFLHILLGALLHALAAKFKAINH